MTNLLVLGGTAWLGGAVARAALARGHQVTCLARGVAGQPPEGARLVVADRDLPGAYDGVRERAWDAVVDVSWQPGQVRSALAALAGRTRHWAYVSSGSVYATHDRPQADESAALLPGLAGDVAGGADYGRAKVACEGLCRAVLGDRLLVARAGLISGHGDRSDRFGYWPARMAAAADGGTAWRGQPVLVPDTPSAPTQTVDVGDLAAWLVRCGEQALTGTVNAVGQVRSLATVLDAVRLATGFDGTEVAVPSRFLLEQGVEAYMGPRSLPLWIDEAGWHAFSDRSGAAAAALGLTHRPLEDLVADALAWERSLGLDRDRRAGLTPGDERDLLDAWRG
jgi:2'-hydroxyisoflavone reductase